LRFAEARLLSPLDLGEWSKFVADPKAIRGPLLAALAAPPPAPVEAGPLLANELGRWTAGLFPAA
jgi:hypothetical protein